MNERIEASTKAAFILNVVCSLLLSKKITNDEVKMNSDPTYFMIPTNVTAL